MSDNNQFYDYILLIGNKVDVGGDILDECDDALVHISLDDEDDIGEINDIIDCDGNDCIGFGNDESGYYVIKEVFQESWDDIHGRDCCKKVIVNDFLKVLEERTRYYCPEAFND